MNNKIIKTPLAGVEVELKEYITGGEEDDIQAPMSNATLKLNPITKQSETELDVGKALKESKKIAVNIVVVKIDEKEVENPYDKIRDMRSADYQFILREIDKIVGGTNFTKPVLKQDDGMV